MTVRMFCRQISILFLLLNMMTLPLLAYDPVPEVEAVQSSATAEVKDDAVAESAPIRLMDAKNIEQTIPERLSGVMGTFLILLLAYLLSNNRKAISWRLVIFGTASQFFLALLVLKTNFGRLIFDGANNFIVKILNFSNEGARFVFGNLVGLNVPVGIPKGGGAEHMSSLVLNGSYANTGAFFAFSILPTVIFFSALTAILYYFGILQLIVRGIARLMQNTFKCSGAESFSAAANIFIGQTEAPLLVKPFLKSMTRSEIMAVMTGGFATVSGGVLAAFVGMLVGDFPDIAGHLIAASVMSAPASLVIAKMMVPETQIPVTLSTTTIKVDIEDANVFDAASRGTSDGLMLALNVGAMLIAFVALIAFSDWILGSIGGLFFMPGLSLNQIFSVLFSPFAFLLGVPWEDAMQVGNLLGMKTAINEFVAYLQLSELLQNGALKHAKSVVIATYALCGFANFASIGIQIGGLSALAPSRRQDFAQLGLRAMIAGTLACFQTAAIAGMLL